MMGWHSGGFDGGWYCFVVFDSRVINGPAVQLTASIQLLMFNDFGMIPNASQRLMRALS
jgi:hypothetical protein